MSDAYTVRGQGARIFRGCLIAGGCIFVLMFVLMVVSA